MMVCVCGCGWGGGGGGGVGEWVYGKEVVPVLSSVGRNTHMRACAHVHIHTRTHTHTHTHTDRPEEVKVRQAEAIELARMKARYPTLPAPLPDTRPYRPPSPLHSSPPNAHTH